METLRTARACGEVPITSSGGAWHSPRYRSGALSGGVAAAITLSVVQSDMANAGGVAPMILYLAESGEVVTISGVGTWPRAVSAEYFVRNHGGRIPTGILRTVVPAAPDAWITALERYGTTTFSEAAAVAIRLAREGFAVSDFFASQIEERIDGFRQFPTSAEIYLPQGRAPCPGELSVQDDLGRSLQYMADQEQAGATHGRKAAFGAARDAFYRGDIAREIVRCHQRNGGFLTARDLADFRVRVEPPVKTRCRAIDVFACGPWSQGPVLLQMLNVLEGFDLRSLSHNSVEYIHTVAEAIKLAFADRERYYGDPRCVEVPINELLSVEYAELRRGMIRPDAAWRELPPAGDPLAMKKVAESQVTLPPPSPVP